MTQIPREPPHSDDAERAIIAVIIHKPEAHVDAQISPDDFYRHQHKVIWQSVISVVEQGILPDIITIAADLKKHELLERAGGLDYLEELIGIFHSHSNLAAYCDLVRGKRKERQMIALGHAVAQIGYDEGSTEDKTNQAEKAINEYMHAGADTDIGESLSSVVLKRIDALEQRSESKSAMLGRPSGFVDLDKHLGGFVDGDLILIAGRPSMGKTTLAMNMAEHFVMRGDPVVVISLEMTKEKLVDRLLCSLSGVDNTRYRTGQLQNADWDKVASAAGKLKSAPLYIDGSRRLQSGEVLSAARRMCYRHGYAKPALVVLDYLQLLADKGEGHERVSTISRTLKLTAEELGCPLIALSQLNRGLEQRPNKRPILSDLRDSGSLEQDADVVLMAYRDIVYNKDTNKKGITEILIRKARDAPVGEIELADCLYRNRFENLTKRADVKHMLPPEQMDELEF